jgi:hypothetical protein
MKRTSITVPRIIIILDVFLDPSDPAFAGLIQTGSGPTGSMHLVPLLLLNCLGFSSSRIRVCFYCGRGKRRGKYFTDTRTKRIGLGANSDSAEDYACSSRSRVSSFTTSKKQTGFWYVFAEFAASKLGGNVPKSSLLWWTAFIFRTVLERIRTVLQGT